MEEEDFSCSYYSGYETDDTETTASAAAAVEQDEISAWLGFCTKRYGQGFRYAGSYDYHVTFERRSAANAVVEYLFQGGSWSDDYHYVKLVDGVCVLWETTEHAVNLRRCVYDRQGQLMQCIYLGRKWGQHPGPRAPAVTLCRDCLVPVMPYPHTHRPVLPAAGARGPRGWGQSSAAITRSSEAPARL